MALSGHMTLALEGVLNPGMRVSSFGYPDIIAPESLIFKMLGEKLGSQVVQSTPQLEYRDDSEVICQRHGLQERPIPDAKSFFSLMDCKLDVYDIVKERGCEILCDLNEPIQRFVQDYWQKNIHESYDIVLDVGTCEHVMNIGQALMNMAGLVKKDGFILHENPHSGWSNHGFYSIHPTLFHDFYSSNGFEVLKCVLVTRDGYQAEVPATKRFNTQGAGDLNILTVARRVAIVPMAYQTQSKYARMIPAAVGPSENDERGSQ